MASQVEMTAPKAGKSMWEADVSEAPSKPWSENTRSEKGRIVLVAVFKLVLVCFLLYVFIISLGLMGNAFEVLAGPTAGQVFRNNEIFDNPLAGLVLGVLATVLVQSSSTSTSIIISMSASNLLEVKDAIPMVMGANIGTSVTNTIVSMFQIGSKDEYRRAFAGATVHDCFNILTVCVLLPIEVATNLLFEISSGIIGDTEYDQEDSVDFLKTITKPVASRIVSVDKDLVTKVAEAADQETLDYLLEQSMIKNSRTTGNHLFMDTPLTDQSAGLILLVVSLVLLSASLILLVKVLQSALRGRLANAMKYVLNLEFQSVPFVADYILVVIGCIVTILLQSSSVTTSTLTPLVGIGLVRLEKMFCFTVGANIGTTVTSVLAALASNDINIGLQVALAHVFFNLFGTLVWFPVPYIRSIPLSMAKALGCVAADWPWFPAVYITVAFGLFPCSLLVLSLIHWAALLAFLAVFIPCVSALLTILTLRLRAPHLLSSWMLEDPKVRGYSLLPPSLMVRPPAEEATAEAVVAGNQAKEDWAWEPFVWGGTWFVLCGLLLVCFNAKWADFEYHKHDSRNHVGLGAWQVCGVAFEAQPSWAAMPATDFETCRAHYNAVAVDFVGNCSDTLGWADVSGRDEEYWSLMEEAVSICSLEDWLTLCLGMPCQGSKHVEQCMNVSEDVSHEYTLSYPVAGVPWTAGGMCRDTSLLCDTAGSVEVDRCGILAVAGLLFCTLGQLALFSRAIFGKHRQGQVLLGSFFMDVIGWLLLVAAAANFGGTLRGDAECVLAVPGNHGFAMAKGTFSDMVHNSSGSYTYYTVIASCVVMAFVLLAVGQKFLADRIYLRTLPK